ncbi:MAG: efflux transporter outer membrane subunit [Luteolibacter sp.]
MPVSRFLPAFSTCSLILLLSACAVIPAKTPEANIPQDWKNAANFPVASPQQDLSRWWKRFNDATLNRLISSALAQNPDVAAASARVRESRANRAATAASLFPGLDAGANRSFSSSDRSGITTTSTSYSAGLDAAWELDFFGKRRNNVLAATAQVGASEENFHSVQASLASEIAIAYTSLRATEARLDVTRRSLKSREETYQIAKWRLEAGKIDNLEASQALSSLEQAKASIPSLEQSASQSRNLLAVLIGQNPGTLDGSLSSRKAGLPNPSTNLAIGIPADTIRQRPDLRLAAYQWIAQVANTNAAKAERYPSFSLSGSLGINTLSSSKIFNPENTSTGLIGRVSAPIFDAGRISANIKAQTAVQEQALLNYQGTVLTALSEVEDSLIACKRTAERITILERATAAAREADTLARQKYEAGITDITTVLDSQRTLLSLEESLISARADRTIAYIQLYKALGGGWS